MSNFEHINLPENCKETLPYTRKGRSEKTFPERNRIEHGRSILAQLEEAYRNFDEEAQAQGIYLDVEGRPGFDLNYNSLKSDLKNKRITQQTITKITDGESETIRSTIFVTNSARRVLQKKIEQYQNIDTPKGKPKNNDLVVGIELINRSTGRSLWKGRQEDYPVDNPKYCEVWVALEEEQNAEDVKRHFIEMLDNLNIQRSNNSLIFSQRIVFLANICDSSIVALMRESGLLCEIRPMEVPGEFFLNQTPSQQREWIDELLQRIDVVENPEVYVSLLDQGVTTGHPLIATVMNQSHCDSTVGENTTDQDTREGHGTLMAGTILYQNLADILASNSRYNIPFGLLSVKILPTKRNDPEMYGFTTQQAVSRSEILKPYNKQIFCMAVTAEESNGQPSSWSSALDTICYAPEEETKRLMLVSAGNQYRWQESTLYPEFVKESRIFDPAQAYNILTVGAYTNKDGNASISPQLQNAQRTAIPGQISPFTSSSLRCTHPSTPLKPEVVFEGGNTISDIDHCADHEDLALLSCESKYTLRGYFTTNNATSCATALAANFAARLQESHSNYWPETIRALMVHSARWTDEMIQQFPVNNNNKGEMAERIRVCGYGVPQEDIAFNSHENSLVYISQSELQPYMREGTGEPKFNEMHIYDLPWPKDVLLNLGERNVTMRITLSYFIEPNPGEGGGRNKYAYASCGLRFDVNNPTETKEQFLRRINIAMRRSNEEAEHDELPNSAINWNFGANSRSLGSIHSDFMTTTAANLAGCSYIAIRPVTGWWKFHKKDLSYEKRIRYSLVVSLEVDDEAIDLYTPVKVQIEQMIQNQIAITNRI